MLLMDRQSYSVGVGCKLGRIMQNDWAYILQCNLSLFNLMKPTLVDRIFYRMSFSTYGLDSCSTGFFRMLYLKQAEFETVNGVTSLENNIF